MSGDRRRNVLLWPTDAMASAWRWWGNVGEQGERLNRMAEFRSARKQAKRMGANDAQATRWAALQARDLQDFSTGGRVTKQTGRYVPFLNPAFVGLFRGIGAAKENPAGYGARWLGLIAAPTVAAYLWNKRHGDLDELREQPAQIRDGFWNFKVAPDTWLRIPRPWEAGVLAGSVERLLDRMEGNEQAWDGYQGSVLKAFMPVDESAFLGGPARGVVEAMVNRDMFKGGTVVPYYEESKALELRKGTEYASELGKLVGGAFGIDPRYVDHIVRGQLGGAGGTALTLSNRMGGRGGERSRAQTLNDVAGLFVESPGRRSASVTRLEDAARRYGLENRKDVAAARDLGRRAMDEEDPADRDWRKAQWRDRAKRLLPGVERAGERVMRRAVRRR